MNTADLARPATATTDRFLRLALRLDAVATLGSGALLALGGGLLDDLTGIPAAVSHWVGAFLTGYAVAVGVLSFRPTINRAAAWAVVVINTVWVIDSVVALVAGFWQPTAAGIGLIVFMAVAVAAFAELQYLGLRRMR